MSFLNQHKFTTFLICLNHFASCISSSLYPYRGEVKNYVELCYAEIFLILKHVQLVM